MAGKIVAMKEFNAGGKFYAPGAEVAEADIKKWPAEAFDARVSGGFVTVQHVENADAADPAALAEMEKALVAAEAKIVELQAALDAANKAPADKAPADKAPADKATK